MKLKSHTLQEIMDAAKSGKQIFALDTGNDGEDDTLTGTHEECLRDVLNHFELEKLPEHWKLVEITDTF